MKDRVLEIMHKEHLNNAEFAKMLEISPASVSSIINGRNKVSLDVATKIIQVFDYVTWDWLILGKGELGEKEIETVFSPSGEPSLFDIAAINTPDDAVNEKNRKDLVVKSSEKTANSTDIERVRYVEKAPRKIREIRIFYDDNTYEIFEG